MRMRDCYALRAEPIRTVHAKNSFLFSDTDCQLAEWLFALTRQELVHVGTDFRE